MVGRLETLLVEQQTKGGVTAAAREKIDRVLDSVGGSVKGDSRDRDPDRAPEAHGRGEEGAR